MALIEFDIRSPSTDTRPDRGHGPGVVDDVIAVMLGTGGAGMVGKDPHHRANRKFRRRRSSAGAPGQNAMFLIGVDHDQTGDRIAREIANHTIALIDGETRGAAITRHRHPSGIDDDPALVMLM